MPDPIIELDEASHTYRVDGEVWPSVTQILKRTGFIDDRYYTPESAYRGRVVAVATALLDRGTPYEAIRLQPEWQGYLAAYREFRATQRNVERVEVRVCNRLSRHAGTIDRWNQADLHVREIKTGGREAVHALQLQGYAECVGAITRDAIYLQADGSWKLVQYDDPDDRDTWFAAITQYNWKVKHER